jgi:hypothetical protein
MCVFMLEEDGGKVEAVVFPRPSRSSAALVVDDCAAAGARQVRARR